MYPASGRRDTTSQSSLSAAWRAQFYYTVAIILAVVIQRFQGQISLFHEFAAFNLAYTALSTGLAALGGSSTVYKKRKDIPAGDRGRAKTLYSTRPSSRSNQTVYIVTSAPQIALIMVQGGKVLLVLLLCGETYSLAKGCTANEDIDGSVANQMWWWFLGIEINVVKRFYVLLMVFCGHFVLLSLELTQRLVIYFRGRPWQGVRLLRQIVEFMVLVLSIEVSLKINHLDGVENAPGFGQVIPLVLLLPVLEAWWDALFSERRTEEAKRAHLPVVAVAPPMRPPHALLEGR